MSLMPTAPRSIGGVLDDAVRLYRKSLPSCLLIALVAALLIAVPAAVMGIRAASVAVAGPQAIMLFMRSPSFWLTIIVVSVIYIGFYNALILNIHAVASDETPSLKTAFAEGIQRALPMFGLWIVFALIVGIGFVLLIIPGIYLLGIFQLSFVALLVENAGVFESLGISRRLIKGHWWRSATIMTVALIIMIVFSFIAGILSGITAAFLKADLITHMIVQQGISAVVNALFLSLYPSFLLAMYYDLKLRNEGDDLAERVAQLQT